MDTTRIIASLFDGIYHPEKECLFCQKLCGNNCAVECIENTFRDNGGTFVINIGEQVFWFRGMSIFLNLIIPAWSSTIDQKRYMIYAFINYLENFPEIIIRMSEYPRLRKQFAHFLKVSIDVCMKESAEDNSFILKDTPFLEKLEYLLYFLENNGADIKHPE